jgi:hypothetical protein
MDHLREEESRVQEPGNAPKCEGDRLTKEDRCTTMSFRQIPRRGAETVRRSVAHLRDAETELRHGQVYRPPGGAGVQGQQRLPGALLEEVLLLGEGQDGVGPAAGLVAGEVLGWPTPQWCGGGLVNSALVGMMGWPAVEGMVCLPSQLPLPGKQSKGSWCRYKARPICSRLLAQRTRAASRAFCTTGLFDRPQENQVSAQEGIEQTGRMKPA